jgi:hypothetical protein
MTFEFVANRLGGALMRYAVVLAGDHGLAEDALVDSVTEQPPMLWVRWGPARWPRAGPAAVGQVVQRRNRW